jgi:hypothetical protein
MPLPLHVTEAELPMQGNVRDFSLAEVLQFISLGRRTGLLEVVVGPERHLISVRNGVIVGIDAAGHGALVVLAETELVPADALTAAVEESRREGRDLGAVLVQAGLVGVADWQRFVQRELERLLYRLFALGDAPFSFRTMPVLELPPLTLDLPTDRAVLYASRWVEAWSNVRPSVPSPQAIYAPRNPPAPGASLSLAPAEQRVLQALRQQADVLRLAVRSGLSLLETAQALARLVTAGYARLVTAG